MDAFSEILGGVVLKGAMFFSAEFSAPWGFDAPAAQDLAPMLAPGAPHLLIYHFLLRFGLVRIENECPSVWNQETSSFCLTDMLMKCVVLKVPGTGCQKQ